MPRRSWRYLKQTWDNWLAHDGPRLAASLSLYSLLSLAPLVILSIGIASLAFGRTAAQNLLRTLNYYAPPAYTKAGDELPPARRN